MAVSQSLRNFSISSLLQRNGASLQSNLKENHLLKGLEIINITSKIKSFLMAQHFPQIILRLV